MTRNENHEKSRPRTLDIPFGIVTHQTIGDCIKELIEISYDIYTSLLASGKKTTIVCGGQSPSYYCLAMMKFKCFDPEIVDIVILPHSMGSVHYPEEDYSSDEVSKQMKDMSDYRRLLKDKKNPVNLNQNVVIIDSVQSGAGINALEFILRNTYPGISITKIAINSSEGLRDEDIHVDHEYILPCQPKFSDTFPRIVTSFHPYEFKDTAKFITHFINLDNPIAQMISDIAHSYPDIRVEDTMWFKLNNNVTDEIMEKRRELDNFRQRAK